MFILNLIIKDCMISKAEVELNRLKKNSLIKLHWALTRQKRLSQSCKVFSLKVKSNHLSKSKSNTLNSFFLQAKWLYNHIIFSLDELYNSAEKIEAPSISKSWKEFISVKLKNPELYQQVVDEKLKEIWQLKQVPIKVKDSFEFRDISSLPTSIKWEVFVQIKDALKALRVLRKNWRKTWFLKFKSQFNSINLKQYWNSHKLRDNPNYFHITKLWSVRVNWANQFKDIPWIEYANAKLIKKRKDFFINITTYQPKIDKPKRNKSVWLDFWIKTAITSSDGLQFNLEVKEDKQLKKLQKQFNKSISKKLNAGVKKIKSSNFFKQKDKIAKKYDKVVNRRKDVKNKVVSFFKNNYDDIVVQDEQISNWKKSGLRWFWRKIQNNMIGGIIGALKESPTTITLSRFTKTTGLCSNCNHEQKLSLWDRTFICEDCGYKEDRDANAAMNIYQKWLNKKIPMEHRNPMLLEIKTYDIQENCLSSLVCERRSLPL